MDLKLGIKKAGLTPKPTLIIDKQALDQYSTSETSISHHQPMFALFVLVVKIFYLS